jgi:hypothetical protein
LETLDSSIKNNKQSTSSKCLGEIAVLKIAE